MSYPDSPFIGQRVTKGGTTKQCVALLPTGKGVWKNITQGNHELRLQGLENLTTGQVFQEPTDGLTKITTRTALGGEHYEVRKVSDDSLANIYADKDGDVQYVQNYTLVSGSDGVVEFYIADGNYKVHTMSKIKRFRVKNGGVGTYTLEQAQAVSLEINEKVILSDFDDGVYQVVDAGDTGGVYKTGLITSNQKLKLIYNDGWLRMSHAGVDVGGVVDNKDLLDEIAATGEPVIVPIGVVGTSGVHTFTNALVGFGSKKSTFKQLDVTTTKNWMITLSNLNGLSCFGFGVDGQATFLAGTPNQDPAAWNSSNYDAWYGSRGVIFSFCRNTVAEDIYSTNSAGGAAIRLEQCHDMKVTRCYGNRSRGNFGDIFYHFACTNISYDTCFAEDFTRIGFVSEGNPSTAIVSTNVNYSNCHSLNGHDGSINYGGSEFAVGMWSENTDDVIYTLCTAKNIEDTGFRYAPTNPAQDNSTAVYNLTKVINAGLGYQAGGLIENISKAKVTYNEATAVGVTSGFVSSPDENTTLDVTYNNCYAKCSGIGANSVAFSSVPSGVSNCNVYINNCVTDWDDTSGLLDSSKNTADISGFTAFGSKFIVRGFENRSFDDVTIKNRTAVDSSFDVAEIKQSVYMYDVIGDVSSVYENVTIHGEVRSSLVRANNVTVKSNSQLLVVDSSISGSLNLIDSVLFISHGAGYTSGKKVNSVLNLNVERDVSASDYALRIQCEQAVKPTFIVNGSFYNSGSTAASDKNFIWAVRSGTQVVTTGAVKDDTVPNILRTVSTPSNFLSAQQDVSMH